MMASRHSRRLQGLGPEHLAYEDRCFAKKPAKNNDQCRHCRCVDMSDSDDDTLSTEDDDDPIWRMTTELRGPTRHEKTH